VTLQVQLVVPEGELWSGPAQRVIAKTLDGNIGVLTGHTPVLGILTPGSVVRILGEEGAAAEVVAAVAGGFLSVADDRVSVLARQAQLGTEVDQAAVRAQLDDEQAADPPGAPGSTEESATVSYLRALLRAAGDEA
jgi:F-type H+-transporting ATPase subunit epsilon